MLFLGGGYCEVFGAELAAEAGLAPGVPIVAPLAVSARLSAGNDAEIPP